MMAQLAQAHARQDSVQMINLVLNGGYDDYLRQTYPNYQARIEDMEPLMHFARQYQTPEEFLTQMALQTNVEAKQQEAGAQQPQIRLSTIHQAKGLEFDAVFLIMLCEGLFPTVHSMEEQEEDKLEEERRLFYVAITRARDELYFLLPMVRWSRARGEMTQRPSRFLAEIPAELMEQIVPRSYNSFPGARY
jgi:DNA helicase-2/ATP-dependent DNA helicase PcrA